MDKKQISGGLLLSYILIIVSSLYGIFITPFMLAQIGTADYGVYVAVASFSATLAVVDLGIGSTVMRYISYFRASNDKRTAENYTAMAFIQTAFILTLLAIISCVFYFKLPQIFGGKFSQDEMSLSKQLFVILIFNMGLNIFENVLNGIITGSNQFIFGNSIKLFRLFIRILGICLLLSVFHTPITLVLIDVVIVIATICIEMVYIILKLKIRPRLHHFDKPLFMESFKYSILLFIQAILSQFNGNIDNILIASFIGAESVCVYSIGLQLYNMFEQFAMAFSNLMLPSIMQQVVNKDTNEQLENTVIKVGRLQFIFLGAVLCGFYLLGKEFITLWLGIEYLPAWTVGLILMVPTMIPLIQNVCLSILRAENRLIFRTVMLSITAMLNFLITYVGVKFTGNYYYAALGTASSLIITNIIGMNIYYYKALHLNVFRIFKNVFSRTWICLAVTSILIALIKNYFTVNVSSLIICIVTFLIVYGAMMIAFGLNDNEKCMIKRMVHK